MPFLSRASAAACSAIRKWAPNRRRPRWLKSGRLEPACFKAPPKETDGELEGDEAKPAAAPGSRLLPLPSGSPLPRCLGNAWGGQAGRPERRLGTVAPLLAGARRGQARRWGPWRGRRLPLAGWLPLLHLDHRSP